ncbi:MAG: serine hydroxymethyltransferase, partial [Mycoplasmataceae bacterium]|nr:serine hydroxymethyltransferase [Mycoplasmataceae bacterium]
EGYPGKRYYDGCQNIDVIETLAIDRLKELFNAKFANVQAHSGSSANSAAIAALVPKGSKILGMSLSSGGHLTHGYKINFSGYFYEAYSYDVDENGLLNYENILKIAKKIKPDLIICGASAYSRIIDFKEFRKIADEVGAKLMADIAHIAGAVATKLHPTPIGYADLVTSTTHKTLRGARGGIIMTNNPEIAKKVDSWIFPGYQGGPLFHVIAGKAVAFKEALDESFTIYQKQILDNSIAFADEFIKLGSIIVSGGTDNHLFTVNVKDSYQLTGKKASDILQEINITVNKNTIPKETESPHVTSGIRLGTPAMTTRGLKEKDFRLLANIIHNVLSNPKDEAIKKTSLSQIKKISNDFKLDR